MAIHFKHGEPEAPQHGETRLVWIEDEPNLWDGWYSVYFHADKQAWMLQSPEEARPQMDEALREGALNTGN